MKSELSANGESVIYHIDVLQNGDFKRVEPSTITVSDDDETMEKSFKDVTTKIVSEILLLILAD